MCIFKKLFKNKKEKTNSHSESWFNSSDPRYGIEHQTHDQLTGKKKKPLMDPIYNCVPGNGQDSNSIKKNGV